MEPQSTLLNLIRAVLCPENPTAEPEACTPQLLDRVYDLASRHDLAHFIGQAATGLQLPDCEAVQKGRQAAMAAAVRDIRRSHDYGQLCKTLEAEEIPFIPLKGSVLCAYYPKTWLRTSCDIDILVQEKDLERAASILAERLGYGTGRKSSHDVAMLSPAGVHLELHYSTIEAAVSPQAGQILAEIWDLAQPVKAGSCHMVIPDDLFYYYHMAHMAKHFVGGGCGIRPLLDTWILRNKVPHDPRQREKLLKKGRLLTFAQAVEKLSRIWLEGEPMDEMSLALEAFILSGGTYGSMENRVAINQRKKGGKFRYAMSRIFLPYDEIKYHYPILMKHKLLLPVYQVVRWFKLLFRGGAVRSVQELQKNASVTAEEGMAAQVLLDYLGLQ